MTSDLPDPTAISGTGPLAGLDRGEPGPTVDHPPSAHAVMAGSSRPDAESDEQRFYQRRVQAIARIIVNSTHPLVAAEAIVDSWIPGGDTGADVAQGEQAAPVQQHPCSLCGALVADEQVHSDWHYTMTWGPE